MTLFDSLNDSWPFLALIVSSVLMTMVAKKTRLGMRSLVYLPLLGAIAGVGWTSLGLASKAQPLVGMAGTILPGIMLGAFVGCAVMLCAWIGTALWDFFGLFGGSARLAKPEEPASMAAAHGSHEHAAR